MDGDGVTREGALHLQLGSGGVTRRGCATMLATSPAAAAVTAHHHPAQGSQPAGDRDTEGAVNNDGNTTARNEVEKHTEKMG